MTHEEMAARTPVDRLRLARELLDSGAFEGTNPSAALHNLFAWIDDTIGTTTESDEMGEPTKERP